MLKRKFDVYVKGNEVKRIKRKSIAVYFAFCIGVFTSCSLLLRPDSAIDSHEICRYLGRSRALAFFFFFVAFISFHLV